MIILSVIASLVYSYLCQYNTLNMYKISLSIILENNIGDWAIKSFM